MIVLRRKAGFFSLKNSWVRTSLEYEKRLLLRCIHHFKSDLINNMDHMRISGTEPSSVKHRV